MATIERRIRRGLPRTAGGEPWPPQSAIEAQAPEKAVGRKAANPVEAAGSRIRLRRGLPRVPGGAPWPPSTTVGPERLSIDIPVEEPETPILPSAVPGAEETREPAAESTVEPSLSERRRSYARVKTAAVAVIVTVAAAALLVLLTRGLVSSPIVAAFLDRYPGEYALPAVADTGFPLWARWSHFLNFFLMALVIRTGLQVRLQKKPPAYWTPRGRDEKISINLWLHTALDVIWLLNGVVFVILLLITGHWARIVPTSWEVFPNALSALLQYVSLDWPTENGWVNYNSLQQLMYFAVVFIAAPLAAVSGVRMSLWWPKRAERLNQAFPLTLARAIHFPTMLFFVLFIIVHVFLVFATGALRNLNHMFAGSDTTTWVGFAWFAAGTAVTVLAVLAARPVVITPMANMFGRVSRR